MAANKQQKIYLIPEGETRDSHTYHYTVVKTKKFIQENEKLKIKKFNPVKRKHEWFVEAKLHLTVRTSFFIIYPQISTYEQGE